jgi:peptidoglycan/xylan/chitin deacetylase (PgdA/CDA1 family)
MRVPILMYHWFAAQTAPGRPRKGNPYRLCQCAFEEQMQHLASQCYRAISLDDFVAHATAGAILPSKPVIITLDDGLESAYRVAYPILEKYGFTGTFFVATSSIGSPGVMTLKQLAEMSQHGMAIQSHSLTHRRLAELSPAQIAVELSESKVVLETRLGRPVRFLAIPNGAYDGRVKRIAKETGYAAVVTSDLGTNDARADLYSLKRIPIKSGVTLSRFAQYLRGRGMFWEESERLCVNWLKRSTGIRTFAAMKKRRLGMNLRQEVTWSRKWYG